MTISARMAPGATGSYIGPRQRIPSGELINHPPHTKPRKPQNATPHNTTPEKLEPKIEKPVRTPKKPEPKIKKPKTPSGSKVSKTGKRTKRTKTPEIPQSILNKGRVLRSGARRLRAKSCSRCLERVWPIWPWIEDLEECL